MDQRQSGIIQEAAKALPPVSVASMTLFGYSLNDWILLLTAIYLVFQIIVIIPKAYHTVRSRRKS